MNINKGFIYCFLVLSAVWFLNACDSSKNLSEKPRADNQEKIPDTIVYQESTPFYQGISRVKTDTTSFYITKNGRPVFKKVLQEFHPLDSVVATGAGMQRSYENEIKTMRIVQTADAKTGMINETGQWIIDPKYDKISFRFNQYLLIEAGAKKTYADSWGDFLVPLKYEDIGILNDTFFDVKKEGKWGVYNAETEEIIIPFTYDQFDYCSGCGQESDYLYAEKDGKWGIINFKNEVLVPFEYEHQHMNMRSDEWVAAFRKNGKNVVIHLPQQKVFSAPEYKDLQIENGFLIASKKSGENLHFGVLNRKTEEVIPFEYSNISNPYVNFGSGAYFSVEKEGKFGIVDTLGTVVIPPQYKNRLLVREDYFISKEDEKMGLLNKNNKQILPNDYEWLNVDEIKTGPEQLDPIVKIKAKGKYGYYYPKTGKLVKPAYDYIEFFNDRQRNPFSAKPVGIISLEKDGKEKLYNLISDHWIGGDYAKFQFQPHDNVSLIKENFGDQGIYDLAKERLIIPIQYKYIKVYKASHQLIKVEKDIGNYQTQAGLFDNDGKEILPIAYTKIKELDATHFLLQKDSLYEIFDAENKTKAQLPFTKIEHGNNSPLLIVQKGKKNYLYDFKNEKLLLKDGYSSIQQLKNGNYLVSRKEGEATKFGYANAEGKLIVPVTYDMKKGDILLNFQDEDYLPLFRIDENTGRFLKGFANLEGEILVPADFQKIFPEENGNGFLTSNNNRFGIITAEGKEILPARFVIRLNTAISPYRETSDFSFPVAFKKDEVWQFIDKDGEILPVKTKNLIRFHQ